MFQITLMVITDMIIIYTTEYLMFGNIKSTISITF